MILTTQEIFDEIATELDAHTNNMSIHVSSADRNKLNNVVVSKTYTSINAVAIANDQASAIAYSSQNPAVMCFYPEV